MRRKGTLVLLAGALIALIVSLISGESYSHLTSLQSSLAAQREKNEELGQYVGNLRHEVRSLRTDSRALEKAARNELGMALPGEIIVFFDDSVTNKGSSLNCESSKSGR